MLLLLVCAGIVTSAHANRRCKAIHEGGLGLLQCKVSSGSTCVNTDRLI